MRNREAEKAITNSKGVIVSDEKKGRKPKVTAR